MPKGNQKGNSIRCKSCHRLAGKDRYCKLHRPQINVDVKTEKFKITRDNYKGYGGFIGKESFFEGEFGVLKDKFDIEGGF